MVKAQYEELTCCLRCAKLMRATTEPDGVLDGRSFYRGRLPSCFIGDYRLVEICTWDGCPSSLTPFGVAVMLLVVLQFAILQRGSVHYRPCRNAAGAALC
jgi:hypothetical protein